MTDTLERLKTAVADRYRIERELGAGGMATVYLAEDLKHLRQVALKVLRPELSLGAERFLLEIRVAAGLRHPNIVPLYDSGEAGDLLYYVMPFVNGESLQQRLDREGRVPVLDALLIGAEVAEALEHAHRHGVIHRDIKPGNILLAEGHAVVTDFGIARAVSAAGPTRITFAGTVVGTPAYMSPEQILGADVIDGRSDVYSLGCVLFEAVSGRQPFAGGNDLAVLATRLTSVAPRLRDVGVDVPVGVEEAISRALAADPAGRYATAAEMNLALGTLASSPGTISSPALRRPGAPASASIAVLPFANLSADRENEYFADGITEEITNALARLDGLRVASRTSAFAFKGKDTDIRRIGTELNVASVLEGSVRRTGNRLRVTAQLVNVGDGYHLWSDRFDCEMHDVFAIQDEIAQAIVATLKVKLGHPSDPRLVKARTASLDAYNLFLEGRFHWTRRGEGLLKAAECFDRAIQLDPEFAPALAALADAHNLIGWYRMVRPAEAFTRAKELARRALALDDSLAEAHTALGFTLMCFDWEWAAAEREFQRALELHRGYATAHHWYAELLITTGRFDQALAEARTALELDPLGLIINTIVVMALYFARDFPAAIAAGRHTLAMDPSFTPVMIWLGLAHLAQREYDSAVRVFEDEQRLSGDRAVTAGLCGMAHARAGRIEPAEQILARLRRESLDRFVSAVDFMVLEEALGHRAEALQELARALEERAVWLLYLRHDPVFDTMRGEPAFIDAVAGVQQGAGR